MKTLDRFSRRSRGARRERRREQMRAQYEQFVGVHSDPLEHCPWSIYSSAVVYSKQTERVTFFQDFGPHVCWSNMGTTPGHLPMPQAFLIRRLEAFGIASDTALGRFQFVIGAKIYLEIPAWKLVTRRRYPMDPPLFLAPQQNFEASIVWQKAPELGRGLSGKPLEARLIQIVIDGELVRPVQ